MYQKLTASPSSSSPRSSWFTAALLACVFSMWAGAASGQTQGNAIKLQDYKQRTQQETAYFAPLDKAAYFIAMRKPREDQAAMLEGLLADLPLIEKLNVNSEPKDAGPIRTRWSIVQPILNNAREQKGHDRVAYFMLVTLNTRHLLALRQQELAHIDQVLASYSPDDLAHAQTTAQVTQQINELLAQYSSSNQRALMRNAFDLAATPEQGRVVESAVLNALKDKLLVLRTTLKAGAASRTSGGDSSILGQLVGQSIDATLNSNLNVNAVLDTKLYKPQLDYILKARAQLTVKGRSKGKRACGILFMGSCDFDEVDTKTFDQPIELALTQSNGYRAKADYNMTWQAASGGSGMASGLLLGGTKIFVATEAPVLTILDMALSPLPRTAMASNADSLSRAQPGSAHPIDVAFQRVDRSTNASQAQVERGVYDDLVRVSNETQDKANAVDEVVQRRNAEAARLSNYGNSSGSSGQSGGSQRYACSFVCRGSMFGLGSRYTVDAFGSGETNARESVQKSADQRCIAENRGRGGAWWADMSLCQEK